MRKIRIINSLTPLSLLLLLICSCTNQERDKLKSENQNKWNIITETYDLIIESKIKRKLDVVKEFKKDEQNIIYREILELDSENLDALWGLANNLKSSFKTKDSAMTVLNSIQVLNPENVQVYIDKAELFVFPKKNLDSAFIYINKAISIDSISENIRLQKAKILIRMNRYNESINCLNHLKIDTISFFNAAKNILLAENYNRIKMKDSVCYYLKESFPILPNFGMGSYGSIFDQLNKECNCFSKKEIKLNREWNHS